MAHTLSITDNVTTISLTTTHKTRDYELSTPSKDKSKNSDEPLITETMVVTLFAATTPLLQTAVNSVELLLIAAQRRNDPTSSLYKTGPRIYLNIQLDGEASVWRAEIIDGEFKPDKDMLKIGWPNLQADGALMVTHRVWEGPEKELQLSTSNASAATGGRTIYNHDDAGTGHDNWVQIDSAQVGGVLPTPVKLVMTHSTGSSVAFNNFWMACNAFSDPANFVHIMEGEARTTGFGTITTDANSSGGNYNLRSFTTTGEIDWVLSAAQMQRTQGRPFRLLMRGATWSGTGLYVKPVLRANDGLMQMYEGDEIALGTSGTQIVDLGSIPLPNGGYQVAWSDHTLVLQARCTGAGTLGVDFIQLTPLDSFQWIKQRGFTLANNDVVTFDNIEGIAYTSGMAIFAPLAGVLKVYPGVTQKLIFLNDEGTSSSIARTFSVRAYIRERRLTV